jgi:hypothetical protein
MDLNFYTPRKLMFKAWNKETNLLMRLNSIDCMKGELFKKNHILLQFTGLYDKQHDEVYEMDVMLMGTEKFIVNWDVQRNGWNLSRLEDQKSTEPLSKENISKAVRLCSYFESDKKM